MRVILGPRTRCIADPGLAGHVAILALERMRWSARIGLVSAIESDMPECVPFDWEDGHWNFSGL